MHGGQQGSCWLGSPWGGMAWWGPGKHKHLKPTWVWEAMRCGSLLSATGTPRSQDCEGVRPIQGSERRSQESRADRLIGSQCQNHRCGLQTELGGRERRGGGEMSSVSEVRGYVRGLASHYSAKSG